MEKSFSVILGGKEYSIKKLSRGESKAVRERTIALIERISPDNKHDETSFDKLPLAEKFHVLDEMYDILFDYSSILKEDMERIEDETTPAELTQAFKVLQEYIFSPFLKPNGKTPENL